MSKYINIVLFSLFGLLSINLNLGFSLYIPFLCFYIYKNIKNILLIISLTILSMFLFNINLYLEIILIFITLLITIISNKEKTIIKQLIICLCTKKKLKIINKY